MRGEGGQCRGPIKLSRNSCEAARERGGFRCEKVVTFTPSMDGSIVSPLVASLTGATRFFRGTKKDAD